MFHNFGITRDIEAGEKMNLGGLPTLAVGIVVLALVVGVGMLVLAQFASVAGSATGLNSSTTATQITAFNTALNNFSSFVPIIIIAALGFFVIGLIWGGGKQAV